MNEEEELNLDDVFDVPRPQYEINRQKLNESRALEPERFDTQLQSIKSVFPDFQDPSDMSEFMLDMAVDAGILGRSFGTALPAGIATVIQRRLAKRVLSESTDYWYKALKLLSHQTYCQTYLNKAVLWTSEPVHLHDLGVSLLVQQRRHYG